ncbi:leukocyte elastase inhibitor [Octopus bimaculoides]|uniref:Serpin domain-containing protein n=1 Tax=Octopus bimaculoides TaxID=37653 RepID=A0A0L8FY86_OCTBM|nr:leukocyte elastase inhibitor [Octopus bimaculoides]|eukprot:XP_014785748.1 PREDICTED: leukocyte elastase inhibitor-like [Octopus bimaculoides]
MYVFSVFIVSTYIIFLFTNNFVALADTPSANYDKLQQYKHDISVPINDFTLKIFKQLLDSKTGNILWSPFLVSISLSFVQMTDKINSAEKIQSLLYPSVSWELFHQSFTEYLKTVQGLSNFQLSNKLYIDPVLLPNININISKYYFLEIDEINPRTIDKLSDKFHKNRISNFMSFGNTNEEIFAVLVNSLHFQGFWKNQFNRKFTMRENFYVTEKQAEVVEMMYTEDYFTIKSDERFSFRSLEIPLVGNRFSFYVVLPDDIEGITSIEKQLTSRLLWQIIANKASPRNVALILPKFQMKSNLTFQDILFKETTDHFFNLENNNLTNTHVHLIDILHQGFLNFNELGTTSSPATIRKSSHLFEKKAKYETSFTVNHPFLFFIVDKTSFMILHVGKCTHPDSSTGLHQLNTHDEL